MIISIYIYIHSISIYIGFFLWCASDSNTYRVIILLPAVQYDSCTEFYIKSERLIQVRNSSYLQSPGRSEQFDEKLYEYYIPLLTSIMEVVNLVNKFGDPDSTEKWVIECRKETIFQCLLCTYSRKPVYEASSKKEHWHLFLEPPQ